MFYRNLNTLKLTSDLKICKKFHCIMNKIAWHRGTCFFVDVLLDLEYGGRTFLQSGYAVVG
jgi:hypothetical protein